MRVLLPMADEDQLPFILALTVLLLHYKLKTEFLQERWKI